MGIKMSKKEFNQIIKDLIGNDKLFGYKNMSNDEKPYSMYYSEDVFNKFVSDMSEEAKKAYNKGAGEELIEHNNKPPKMASVASSSRFCYLALHNGIDITIGNDHISGHPEFEKVCKINGIKGTSPHLDAYIDNSNCYFEVKCQEIFDIDQHKIILSTQYWNLIYGKDNAFGNEHKEKPDEKEFKIPYSEFGLKDCQGSMFDIKQLICHLLAIANQDGTNKKLVYLFFRPDPDKLEMSSTINENELEKVFDELKTEIEHIFGSKPIKTFCDKEHIKLMAIAEKSAVMEQLTNKNLEVLYTS
ncbi:MAG: hypothetical protein IKH71_15870 [Oscillospiraceae bacterium]|nr:hypothetical protein [Oscillospiraceae bacterium]